MIRVLQGDCLDWLKRIPDQSIDAVITDPPYPGIKREYGTWTEAEWHAMMDQVVPEVRRSLTPTGSAVFVLQPNFGKVGTSAGRVGSLSAPAAGGRLPPADSWHRHRSRWARSGEIG